MEQVFSLLIVDGKTNSIKVNRDYGVLWGHKGYCQEILFKHIFVANYPVHIFPFRDT